MIKVVLPDGLEKTYRERTTVGEVAEDLGGPFKKKALAGKTNGTLVDLSFPLTRDTSLSVITEDSPEALEILRHSTAHIMAQAVCRLFPGAKLGIGPTIENGFYYDFHLERPLTEEDLANIEAEMRKIIKEDISFSRKTLSRNEAIKKMGKVVKRKKAREEERRKKKGGGRPQAQQGGGDRRPGGGRGGQFLHTG